MFFLHVVIQRRLLLDVEHEQFQFSGGALEGVAFLFAVIYVDLPPLLRLFDGFRRGLPSLLPPSSDGTLVSGSRLPGDRYQRQTPGPTTAVHRRCVQLPVRECPAPSTTAARAAVGR